MKKYESCSTDRIPMFTNEVEIDTTEYLDVNNLSGSTTIPEMNCTPKSTISLPKFSESEYYNGAVYDNYCWGQNKADLDICIILPEYVKNTKDIKINLTSSKLLVTDRSSEQRVLIDGNFKEKCRPDSLLWSLSNRKLQISLGKYAQ